MEQNQTEKIRQLLESFSTAILITHGEDQPHHARPMAIAKVESNCDLWFFTGRGSPKVAEIQKDDQVLVVCQNEHAKYISLSGRADLVNDKNKTRELWKESFRSWFPAGADDPDLLLISVRAESAEYWDPSGFKGAKYLFAAAKAYATGTRPEIKEGEQHGRVELK